MVTIESGLQYKYIKICEGPSLPVGFQVPTNNVVIIPSGQIFDSSLEKGQPYIFCVDSCQVIKGLDEGILSMKVVGNCRLYIPGHVSVFSNELTSGPRRRRVAPNSPVVFDVSLQYVAGYEDDNLKFLLFSFNFPKETHVGWIILPLFCLIFLMICIVM